MAFHIERRRGQGCIVGTSSVLLRQTRRACHLSQREAGRRSAVAQPALADWESGRHDPVVENLAGVLGAFGHRLIAVPTLRHSAAEAADAVWRHLRAGDERRAYRELIQLNDDLAAEHGAVRVALAVACPGPTGDDRFDAFIAALVEHRLAEEGLPVPEWVDEPSRFLDETWVVDPVAPPAEHAQTPTAFGRHGVVVHPDELASA